MKFYNGMETISNFKNGTMTLMHEQSDEPPIFSLEPFDFEIKPGNDDLLDDLQRLIDGQFHGSPHTKEQRNLFEKMNNEHHIGLYMTNDEVLKLVGKRLQRLSKWDYETRSYHKYGVPAEWKVSTCCADMSQIINCAGCGKELPYGETFTSLEIHTKIGIGYGVCNDCYEKEWERRRANK